ncbi:MAG: IPT/TIG domain-containing protein [Bryobacterales bacterium]|nr:IPT/TIG domain-containing protein [Bryobacterales bacterium]
MRLLVLLAVLTAAAMAQPAMTPVIDPRGVVNAFTQQPAPSLVAPGGILWINGLNLGPAADLAAPEGALPTELGGTQVRINNRPAPIYSVSTSKIAVQVPWETPGGLMQVVVQRNGVNSRPARVNIANPVPAVRTREDRGYGEPDAVVNGSRMTLRASGLGLTSPRLNTGEPAQGEPRLVQPAAVHVGGVRVDADIRASEKRVGEFEISFDVPASALPGDIITVESQPRLANFVTWRSIRDAAVSFLPLPDGTPEIRGLQSSDLRGGFLLLSGARNDQGCYPSLVVDLRAQRSKAIGECLTSANRNAPTPAVLQQNGAAIAAFVGPPMSENPGQPVSSKVAVFHPEKTDAMPVDLPGAATALVGLDSDSFAAIIPGPPQQLLSINTSTGDVQPVQGAPGIGGVGGAGGAGGAPGGGIVAINPNLQIDLGDGINKILSNPVNIGQQQILVVVGDDEDNPKKAKLAILNPQGAVTGSRDFPEGWVPLVMPRLPVGPGLPGGGPGGGGPGGAGGGAQAALQRLRVAFNFDGQTRTFHVVGMRADNSAHGMVSFGNEVSAEPLPSGWFVASCAAQAQVLSIETARRLVLLGGRSAEREFRAQCTALSFQVFELDGRRFTSVELPGSGALNVQAGAADLNDFLLGQSPAADVIFALDGVTLTPYRMDVPQGLVGFNQLQPVPALEIAVAAGRTRQAGDGGFIVFDLRNVEVRQLLLPDGIAQAQLMGVIPATRRLVARGTRTGNAGSQYLIYDLQTGEVFLPANPPGVTFVGGLPAQPPTPGQPPQPQQPAPVLQRLNPKANTIEAVTFGADRRQNGVMLVRIP